ncbi:MAG: response regulator [Xanthomonadales bacterium]|mgnify:FL=1|jgi:DNA-binding response OmpR family regulator|nr:response regulator [Xanthomonadales bacterium]
MSEPTSPATGLHAMAVQWVQQLNLCLQRGWPLDLALALQDTLDALVDAADHAGDARLFEQTLAISVYLSSFMEEGRHPDDTQREHLRLLCEAIAPGEISASIQPSAREVDRGLLLVSSDDQLALSLDEALRGKGIQLIVRSSVDEAIADPAEGVLNLVVVDANELADFSQRSRTFSQIYRHPQRRCALHVLTRSGDLNERMFALRAGADEVLRLGEDLAPLVNSIVEAVRPGPSDPFRVLIVDDDRSQSMFCEAVLRSQNIETRVASDARQVEAEVRDFQPEVVLLDLHMPEVDGIEMAARIRALPGGELLSIVFLSGDHEKDVRFDVLAAGGDDYFTKPIPPRHLVTGVISRARRTRALAQRLGQAAK